MKKSLVKNQKSLLLILLLTLFFLGLDQFSKTLIITELSSPLNLTSWFSLTLEKNVGIAFSIAIPFPLLIFLNITFFSILITYLFCKTKLDLPISQLALGLLSAGAIGNLLDRLRLGYVIDFIAVGKFPVFNLADSFITVSVFLLLLFYDRIRRLN